MEIDFWNTKDISLVDFMRRGSTMNSDAYCVTLRKTTMSYRKQTTGSAVVLLLDNPRPHVSEKYKAYLGLLDRNNLINDITVPNLHLVIFTCFGT